MRSTAKIVKGTFICVYDGRLLTPKQLKEREQQLNREDNDDTSFLVSIQTNGETWGVDATEEDGSLGRLLNHSRKKPNCQMKISWLINLDKFPGHCKPMPHAYFVASADIAKGEELKWDYGETRGSKLKSHPWLKN